MKVAAVVVTYNRLALLQQCLQALSAQSRPLDFVLVIDNCSTDGSGAWLSQRLADVLPQAEAVLLEDNIGGAGGFYEGLRRAVEYGADWIWMMDDDAYADRAALAELLSVIGSESNVYGSLAVHGDETSWLTTLVGEKEESTFLVADVPKQAEVRMLPFLGFMIHRNLVAEIGFPDKGFFIAADDAEYCLRAQRAGAKVVVARDSRIEHPQSKPYTVRLPGHTLTALALPPWKRYYDTRNRILIARKYYGFGLVTRTIPGSLVRLIAALVKEPDKVAQARAWCCGMYDGLRGVKGKRHVYWGIK